MCLMKSVSTRLTMGNMKKALDLTVAKSEIKLVFEFPIW